MTLTTAIGLSWGWFLVGVAAGSLYTSRKRPAITRVIVTDVPVSARDGRIIHVGFDGSTHADAVDAVIEASRP